MRRLGLIVNPFAGLGGPLAMKGSDDPFLARSASVEPAGLMASQRAARAIRAFRERCSATILTGPNGLGGDLVPDALIVGPSDLCRSAADTTATIVDMQGRVDLILFCGGDGSARDVMAANVSGIPVLGIPAGVKMHSGIFARSPERAGYLAADFLNGSAPRTERVEILDIDEVARQHGKLSAQIFGVADSPLGQGHRQNPKAGSSDLLAETDAALGHYAHQMSQDTLFILGPGTTMAGLKDRLGGGTLLGVDLALNGQIIARDLNEATLTSALDKSANARIVLTVVGGQGFILGRGNQQISAKVIRQVGTSGIDVICPKSKLAALHPQELTIDTGDIALDQQLSGYWQIITGPGQRQVVRVVH